MAAIRSENTGYKNHWRVLVATVVFVAVGVAVVRNRGQFADGFVLLRQVSPWVLVYSVALFLVAMLLAAFSYRLLALRPVHYRQLLLLELAAAGINRVLPAGSGSMGLHGLYLVKHRHTVPQATTVVGVNNTLGLASHLVALLVVGLWQPAVFHGLHIAVSKQMVWIAVLVVLLVCALLLNSTVRRTVTRFLVGVRSSLGSYRSRKWRVLVAAITLLSATWLTVGIFVLCAQAVGIHIHLLQGFIVYSIGVLFGAAVPTPGGLGGVEAGLVAGLVARGSASPEAIAAALLFRLITYWLPLLVGTPAFFVARARKLI